MPTQALTKTHTSRARDDSNKSTTHTNPPTTISIIHDSRPFEPTFPFPFSSQTQRSRERAKVLYAVLQRGTEAAQAPGAPPPQAEHWNALQVRFVWHVWDRIVACVCTYMVFRLLLGLCAAWHVMLPPLHVRTPPSDPTRVLPHHTTGPLHGYGARLSVLVPTGSLVVKETGTTVLVLGGLCVCLAMHTYGGWDITGSAHWRVGFGQRIEAR